MIIFGSVRFLSKKVTKSNFFFEKKTETGSNRPVSVRFFRAKTGSNRFGSVFSVLAWFFPVLARFGLVFFWFFVGFSSIWFGFFGFLFIKLKPNRPAGFFKNLIGLICFFSDRFFRIFFFRFSRFNRFSGFFPHSYWRWKNIQLEKKNIKKLYLGKQKYHKVE